MIKGGMELKKLLFLAVSIFLFTIWGNPALSIAKEGANVTKEQVKLFIAYTCNTWGQLKPCPS